MLPHPETDPMEGNRLAEVVRVLREMAGRDGAATLTWTYPDGEYQSLTVSGPDHRSDQDDEDDDG